MASQPNAGAPAGESGKETVAPPQTQPVDLQCWISGARRGLVEAMAEEIVISVVNPEAYLKWADTTDVKEPHHALSQLVPYFDGVAQTGAKVSLSEHETSTIAIPDSLLPAGAPAMTANQYKLHFRLKPPGPENLLAKTPANMKRSVTVGLGFEGDRLGPVQKSFDARMPDAQEGVEFDLVPRWTAPPRPPAFVLDVHGWVSGCDKATAGLNDTITVSVVNPEAYIQWAMEQDKAQHRPNAPERTIDQLVLFLGGKPLPGVISSLPARADETLCSFGQSEDYYAPIYEIKFRLLRDSKNNDAWAELLDRPTTKRRLSVSVGFEGLPPMDTKVVEQPGNENVFDLIVIPEDWWTASGAILVAASVVIFFLLAGRTDLIRDTGAPPKPDGRKRYSLARTQMAFWFFLVFSTYFFIWVITGDKDTIPGSVLGLIGISAATAVGSAIVDSGGRQAKPGPSARLSRAAARTALEQQIASVTASFDSQIAAAAKPEEKAKLEQDRDQQLAQLQNQLEYFRRERWQVFLFDLLSEDDSVSFHRFQIVVWTLVLGIIFLKEVYMKLAMPDFSGTLLGLMGISAGTFVTLKKLPAGAPDKR